MSLETIRSSDGDFTVATAHTGGGRYVTTITVSAGGDVPGHRTGKPIATAVVYAVDGDALTDPSILPARLADVADRIAAAVRKGDLTPPPVERTVVLATVHVAAGWRRAGLGSLVAGRALAGHTASSAVVAAVPARGDGEASRALLRSLGMVRCGKRLGVYVAA